MRPSPEVRPLLLELALESRRAELMLGKQSLRRIADARLRARRFVFDETASEKSGRFALECADIVCENAQFALPPFPDTYVEVDQIAALRSSLGHVMPDAAKRLGFLFLASGDVFTVSGGDPGKTEFNPFRYHRNGEGASIFQGDEAGWTKRDFILGEIAPALRDGVDAFAPRLTDVWEVSIARDMPGNVLDFFAAECRGQLKRAMATLLLLNQKRGVRLAEVPTARRISKGKVRPYLAHSVVSIDLGGGGDIRQSFKVDDRASPRRHEVRGHFVHYGIDEGCSHEWEDLESEESRARDMERLGRVVPRWRCPNCGGVRVRREAFLRGDAGKGFVVKQYDVTHRGAA